MDLCVFSFENVQVEQCQCRVLSCGSSFRHVLGRIFDPWWLTWQKSTRKRSTRRERKSERPRGVCTAVRGAKCS